MKKYTLTLFKLLSLFFVLSFATNELRAQGVSTATVTFTGYTNQCCSANTTPYFCFNDSGSGFLCGNSTSSSTQTFSNPVPAGNIVTQVAVTYYAANCGGSATAILDGTTIGTDNISSGGCSCTGTVFSTLAGSATSLFPCGLPGYNNTAGATETITFNFSGTVCISKAVLSFTYAPSNQAVPAFNPGSITGNTTPCPGSTNTYSISAVSNATTYTWTVPAGWSINSGQGSNVISVTAGTSSGNVCVTAGNLCGNSSQQCLTVSPYVMSTAPTGATASPSSVCPGNPSTLSVTGGSLGTGASWNWYSGSCNGTAVGTGSSISVSPSSATTYYVNAVGTCNTTSCASVAITIGGTTATPGAPSGSTSICSGSTQTYTTSGTVGASSYNWTVPAGANINSGQGTNSISVTWGSTGGNVCVTATGACGTSAAACTAVTITTPPSAPGAISGTTPVCLNDNDSYSISAVSGATSYNWTLSGGGSLTPSGTSASVNWTTAGTFTISVSATNGCGTSANSNLNVTVNPLPTINISPSSSVICSGNSATLTASGANTYSWNDPSTLSASTGITVVATPTANPTTYTVTGTDNNNCINTNTVSITVNASPTITVSGGGGNSQIVCGGGVTNATVNGITFSVNPAGTVDWTNTNTNIGLAASGTGDISSYPAPTVTGTTSISGVITATASASATGCPSTSSTQLTYSVTILQIPAATTASVTPASCGANDGVISGITGTGGSGSYSYSWDSGTTYSTTADYTNGAGTYTLYVKDNVTGCIYPDAVTISNVGAPAPPTVTPSSTAACVGSTVTLTIASPVSGTTYSWTEANGSSGTGTSYTVVNIPGTPNPYTVSVAGTASGCTGTATTTSLAINMPPTPVISSATNGQVCAGSTLTLSVTPTGANYSYQWGNSSGPLAGETNSTLNATTADTYSVLVTDNNTGCFASTFANGTVTVNSLPVIDVSNITVSSSNCTVATGSITNVSITGTPTLTYTWTTGTTSGAVVATGTGSIPDLSNVSAGAYCLNVTDGNTCTQSYCTVTVPNTPAPSTPTLSAAGNDTTYCQGQTIMPLIVTTTGTATVNWYSDPALTNILASNTNTYTPSGIPVDVPTTIYVAATDNGCVGDSLPIIITINSLPTPPTYSVPLGSDTAYCQGIPSTLSVNSGTTMAVWYFNGTQVGTGSTYTPPSSLIPGTYTLYVIDSVATSGGCTSSSWGAGLPITFTVNSLPSADFSSVTAPDTAKCGKNTGGVNTSTINPTGGTGPYTYQWYDLSSGIAVPIAGATSPILSGQASGSYSLAITDANGCVATVSGGSSTFTVPATSQPVAGLSADPLTGTVPLAITYSNSSVGGTSYVWNYGDNSPISTTTTNVNTSHTYTAIGTYTTTLIASNMGCNDTARVTIIADVATTLIVPNIFTPNGDGTNDNFFIVNTGMQTLSCLIYDRWGLLMSTLTAPQQVWDGTTPNGQKAPDGTYIYILEAHGNDGKTYKQQGTVTLVR